MVEELDSERVSRVLELGRLERRFAKRLEHYLDAGPSILDQVEILHHPHQPRIARRVLVFDVVDGHVAEEPVRALDFNRSANMRIWM